MDSVTSVTGKAFISSIAKFSISSWTGFIMGIMSVSITTRIFTPEITGVLNMFASAVGFFVSFSRLGMNSVVSRFYYEPPLGWTMKQMFTRCTIISVGFMMFNSVLLFTDFFDDIFLSLFQTKNSVIRYLFVINALSVMVLTHFLSQFYRYSNDAFNFTLQQILMQFFSKIFVIAAVIFNPTVEIVLFFNNIGMFFLMTAYVIIQRNDVFEWKSGGWRSKEFCPLYRFAFFSWPSEMIMQISIFSLPYLITVLLGASELGIYSSAGFFSTAFMLIQGGFSTYWSAFMYRYYRTEKEKICKIHSYVSLAVIILMIVFIVFQHIAYMLIGESFRGSRMFFTLILLPPVLLLLEQTTAYGITLSNKMEQNMFITFFCAIINVCAVYMGIKELGVLGAAVGVAFTAVIRYFLMTWRGQIYYRSIRSITETFSGFVILLILSMSNVIFYSSYFKELSIVVVIIFITGIIYKQSMYELYKLIHK